MDIVFLQGEMKFNDKLIHKPIFSLFICGLTITLCPTSTPMLWPSGQPGGGMGWVTDKTCRKQTRTWLRPRPPVNTAPVKKMGNSILSLLPSKYRVIVTVTVFVVRCSCVSSMAMTGMTQIAVHTNMFTAAIAWRAFVFICKSKEKKAKYNP